MLDSGGWLGVRELVIFLLFLISVFRLRKIHLHDRRLVFLVVILISVCASISVNYKSLKVYDALMFSAPILIAPAFYLFSRSGVLTAEILCSAGLIFSYFLLVFYIGVNLEINPFLYLHNQLIELPSAGYFGYTLSAVTGTVQPGFYFRCTLLLVPISLLYLQQNLKWNYLICFMAIVIADTRAGIFVVLLCSLLIMIRRFMSPLKFLTISIKKNN